MMQHHADIPEHRMHDAVMRYWELVLGLDYTFEVGLYIMGEFYHNTLAKDNWSQFTLNDWMWLFTAESKALSRDQLFTLFQYPATDLMNIGSMIISRISDGSLAVVPMITYSPFQDVELTVFGNFYIGKEGKTFASNMGNGGLTRLRVYF